MHIVTSQAGYSMAEVLISTTLGCLVLTGVFDLYISSQNSILGQTNQTQMQTDTKTVMDYLTKELRLMSGAPTISSTNVTNDTISFARIEASGYSSGGNTVTTLQDSHKSWTANAFASGAYSVQIINGLGVGEMHPILSNTAQHPEPRRCRMDHDPEHHFPVLHRSQQIVPVAAFQ